MSRNTSTGLSQIGTNTGEGRMDQEIPVSMVKALPPEPQDPDEMKMMDEGCPNWGFMVHHQDGQGDAIHA